MSAVLLALAVAAPPGGKFWVFLGTYTGKGGSQGIYRCAFDAADGKLGEPQLAAEVGNPSFVTLRPDGKVLYAVGEGTGKDGGGVYAFTVDAKTGTLTKLDQSTSGGAGPCHVVCHPAGRALLVTNYGAGSWSTHQLFRTGKFVPELRHLEQLTGSGPNKARQAGSHAHCGAFTPDGKAMFVVDLGGDAVHVSKVEQATGADESDTGWSGKFILSDDFVLKLPAGSGPRHIALDPAGGLAFICGELDSTLNVVRYDMAKRSGEVMQSVSTLPGGRPVAGNSTAEVVRHPSGKFVYVSNRGHNSIATFGWDGQKLTPLGHATQGIKVPRNFNLSPDGNWMLVANQDGNDVLVFKVGPDGLPTPTGTSVKVGRPVCVKFLARE